MRYFCFLLRKLFYVIITEYTHSTLFFFLSSVVQWTNPDTLCSAPVFIANSFISTFSASTTRNAFFPLQTHSRSFNATNVHKTATAHKCELVLFFIWQMNTCQRNMNGRTSGYYLIKFCYFDSMQTVLLSHSNEFLFMDSHRFLLFQFAHFGTILVDNRYVQLGNTFYGFSLDPDSFEQKLSPTERCPVDCNRFIHLEMTWQSYSMYKTELKYQTNHLPHS